MKPFVLVVAITVVATLSWIVDISSQAGERHS
jgi:hypothetical protein